jgi:mono/diheme cytochrome c family protein
MITTARNTLSYALAACALAMNTSPAVAQSSGGSPANPSRSNPSRFLERDGEAIYRVSCQACHMPAGQGAVGAGAYPALAKNSKLQAGRYVVSIVVNGAKAMPPFGGLLDDEQVSAVVNYVRTHFGNGSGDSVSADDVKAARRSGGDAEEAQSGRVR